MNSCVCIQKYVVSEVMHTCIDILNIFVFLLQWSPLSTNKYGSFLLKIFLAYNKQYYINSKAVQLKANEIEINVY